jgi:N-acyl-D-aspartate/D-glutamate deacylase
MATKTTGGIILIRNGRVYDHAGNVDLPPVADVLIIDGAIAAIRAGAISWFAFLLQSSAQ